VALLGAKASNGNISADAFVQYYSEVNAVVPNERENYFVDMLVKTWGLDSDKCAVSPARLAELKDCIFEKVR